MSGKEGIELRRCQFSTVQIVIEDVICSDFRPALAQTHTFRSKSTAIDAIPHFSNAYVMIDLREHGVSTYAHSEGMERYVQDIYDGDSLQVVL
jgi:hypothetical protein